jgi:hypothetical protein
VGAVQMLGGGGARWGGDRSGRSWRPGLHQAAAQVPTERFCCTGTAWPWGLRPSREQLSSHRLPSVDAGAKPPLASLSAEAETKILCPLRKLPLATYPNCSCPCGSWPWRSRDWWQRGVLTVTALCPLQGRRLLAAGGSVPAQGAVRSDSKDVAVALVGRSGEEREEKAEEPSSASQA